MTVYTLLTEDYLAKNPDGAVGSGIVPEFHFRMTSTTSTPKIVIVGDSISTNTPTTTFDESDSLWGQIQRAFLESNPHLTPVFMNFAWGGRTWSNCLDVVNTTIAGGAAAPVWNYGSGAGTWLSYVQAENPDLVIFAFGMNDRQNFVTAQAKATINNTRTWTKVPDLMMVTPMVPNRTSADANISSTDSQEGRYFTAHWMRTWALYNRVALLDLNRQYAKTVQGIDPRTTFFVGSAGSGTSRTLPYSYPTSTDQDVGIEITGAASLFTSGLSLSTSRTGVNSRSELHITNSSGFIRLQFVDDYTGGGSPVVGIDVTTAVATPASNFTLTAFFKDNMAFIKLGSTPVYEGPVIRHGGRFVPVLRTLDGSTPTATLRTWVATYVTNNPSLSDSEMWGVEGTSTSVTGGNRLNHPTSKGAAYVYRPLVDAHRWNIPSLTMGATSFTGTMGRNIGVGTSTPNGRLHVTKTAMSSPGTPTPTANTFVVEDETASGMTLMTGPSGAMRYLMGTAASPSLAGVVGSASNGQVTIRAVDQDVARLVDPSDLRTSLQLLVNIGGVKTMLPVRVGAADSGGTGFRVLRVDN